MDTMSSERLADAAKNMVEAINRLTSSVASSQGTTNEHLVELKDSLGELKNETRSMKEEMQSMKEEIKVLRDAAQGREADKMRRIEFAIQNLSLASKQISHGEIILQVCDIPAYESYDVYSDLEKMFIEVKCVGLEALLCGVLFAFRRGHGFCVEAYFMQPGSVYSNTCRQEEVTDEKIQSFRDRLSGMLHDLLGKEPKFECDDSCGKMFVYYNDEITG